MRRTATERLFRRNIFKAWFCFCVYFKSDVRGCRHDLWVSSLGDQCTSGRYFTETEYRGTVGEVKVLLLNLSDPDSWIIGLVSEGDRL